MPVASSTLRPAPSSELSKHGKRPHRQSKNRHKPGSASWIVLASALFWASLSNVNAELPSPTKEVAQEDSSETRGDHPVSASADNTESAAPVATLSGNTNTEVAAASASENESEAQESSWGGSDGEKVRLEGNLKPEEFEENSNAPANTSESRATTSAALSDISGESSAETLPIPSAEPSAETSEEPSIRNSVENSAEASSATSAGDFVDNLAVTSTDTSTDTSADLSTELSIDSSTGNSTDSSTDASSEAPTERLTEISTEISVENAENSENSSEISNEASEAAISSLQSALSSPPPPADGEQEAEAESSQNEAGTELAAEDSRLEEGDPEAPEEEEPEDEEAWPSYDVEGFIKGELTSLGTTKLLMHNNRVGLRTGVSKIHDTLYGLLSLELDLRFKKFAMGLQAPVQFRLVDPDKGVFGGGLLPDGARGFRFEDYDEFSEILRVVRFIRYGSKEERFFLNLASETALSLGHGAMVRRYLPNVDVDRGRLAAQFDGYGKYGGVETLVGDVLRPDSLFGVLAFAKPFGNSNELMLQSLSIGLSYAADLNAPYSLERDDNGRPIIGKGADAPTAPVVAKSAAVHIAGLSVESKMVKTRNADIKPWVDLSKMIVDGASVGAPRNGGGGLTLGVLGRFNFLENKHAVRVIAEGRVFQGNYLPGYFDTTYQVQRYQHVTGKADSSLKPKLHQILNRPSDLQLGYYLELQYSWIRRFALTAAWEDATVEGSNNLVLHLEVPTFKYLKLFATMHQRSVETGLLDVFRDASGQLSADNTLFYAGARLRVLPFLFLNGRLYRSWMMDSRPEFHTFRNVEGFEIDLELGFEFGKK